MLVEITANIQILYDLCVSFIDKDIRNNTFISD